ncbi:hypothetical protein GF314_08605 [bacterium]|nr:hypothetical protein [bacterium]
MLRSRLTVLALLVLVAASQPVAAQTAFGDTLFSFNAGQLTPTPDRGLNGVAVAEDHIWVTGFNAPTYDHQLYRFALDGSELVGSTSLGSGYHAYYDLAFDGEFLWVTDRDHLAQIDPATGQLTGEQIPTDFGYYLVQGVAHDPATDHFWVIPQRNGQLQVIHEIDRQGNVLATYPNLAGDYTTALTWDTWSPGGPYLWTFSRYEEGYDSFGAMRQFNPAIGAFTGVSIEMINRSDIVRDSPRGVAMTDAVDPSTVAMVAVQAGALEVTDGLDWVVAYDADLREGQPGATITVSPPAIQVEVHQDDTVTVPVFLGNTGDLDLTWNAYVENADTEPGGDGELGDVLAAVDVTAAVGEPALVTNSATFARDHHWVSARIGFDDRRLVKIDRDGDLVDTFPIGGVNSLGWGAIATDGDHIYGTDTYSIAVWSIDEQQVVDNVVTGSISNQALAYDPDNEHFYLGGGNGAIEVLDRQGDQVRFVTTPYDIEGLAWDDLSPGGPYLWAWIDAEDPEIEGEVRCEAVRLDPVSGLATGVGFLGADQGGVANVPEAVTVTRDAVTGKLALVGLQETDQYPGTSFLVGYDLDVTLPPAWISLDGATLGAIVPEGTDTLRVAIHGTMADTTTAAVIRIASNDPARPLVEVPVTTAMLRPVLAGADDPDAELAAPMLAATNHPNPFNPRTTISYELRAGATVSLEINDVRGRRVATMRHEARPPGRHAFVWDGTDQRGRPVASGVYVYTVRAGDVTAQGKMLLSK